MQTLAAYSTIQTTYCLGNISNHMCDMDRECANRGLKPMHILLFVSRWIFKPPGSLLLTVLRRDDFGVIMFIGVDVSCHFVYSLVSYLYVKALVD